MPKIIVVKPGAQPEVVNIESGLKPMQDIVGGFIENVTLEKGIGLICNEEGKLQGLPPNRRIAELQDTIRGNFFISRYNDDGETVDVTAEDIAKWTKRFALA